MRMGLRAKSVLALGVCIAVVLALAALAGWRALGAVEENLGLAFARNATQYNKQRILAPVARELALSQRLADSAVTRQWLLDENNAAKKTLFFREAEGYRQAFVDKSYFIISGTSRNYYFNDRKSRLSDRPRYALSRSAPHDAWFFSTLKKTEEFNINVDPDVKLKVTKVWFNVLVKDGERNIGLAGTGLDLSTFLQRFINSAETGVTPILLNRDGYIQAHPNAKYIDYASINDKGAKHSTIDRLLVASDVSLVRAALKRAQSKPESIETFWASLEGRRSLFAVSFVPELNWHVLTAVDLRSARVLDSSLWLPLAVGAGVLLALLVLIIFVSTDRLLLRPLFSLTQAVRQVGKGDYATAMPRAGNDEVGELTRAFGVMAAQVRTHTAELETKVQARTQELTSVNKQIGDSIQYASLIQNAILPGREIERTLGENQFVLWLPRDVVGGDFWVFRADDQGCLVGVVDCAGHGVPGALMTMVAQTSLDVAMDAHGLRDPALLLTRLDARIRLLLPADMPHSQTATTMDAGLMYFRFDKGEATFAGAKISLLWSDGAQLQEWKGDRFSIGGKRQPTFSNQTIDTALLQNDNATFYLSTDGLLDQAGGDKGLSLGRERLAQWLHQTATQPLSMQREFLTRALAQYQGALPQRDDIALLGFRTSIKRD